MVDLKKLVAKIQEMTNSGEAKWETLNAYLLNSKNEPLRQHIINVNKGYYNSRGSRNFYSNRNNYIKEYSSFSTTVCDGIITVITFNDSYNDYYLLCAQSSASGRVVELNVKQTLQDEINSLIISIKNKVDNIDNFLEKIINE